ncbi:MAG TPA: signal peptide peptidase SppA [Flavitalea sp.]|nr:signal peptide peptidase SppA [Flavitalea sp.]
MRSFFKTFLAALLAIVVFFGLIFLLVAGATTALVSRSQDNIGDKGALALDLGQHFAETEQSNPLAEISRRGEYDVPSLYEVIRIIRHAKDNPSIKGVYIRCGDNGQGFAAADEIRNAIKDFKESGKFVYAFADVINQRAYYIASIADKVYCNPKGGVDWTGFVMQMPFVKGALEKLEIEPQIFYAGKFKSATEPFRENRMTDANRLQTSELLGDLYGHFLLGVAEGRGIDTATLHRYAMENLIRFPSDALQYGLVDGLKYEDEVKEEMRERLGAAKDADINLIRPGKYASAVDFKQHGRDRIAVIYAEGDIIEGKGERDMIGSETYSRYIARARNDESVKAVVFRVNSGGGSALASENLWRELTITREKKPVVVSFGDVAASGGYYLACNADSIFAQPNTITGSIGVFGILPNMQAFFNKKLGVSFDAVKTAPDADAFSVVKPLTPLQKQYFQSSIDSTYHDFKRRVAEGRKMDIDLVDSIAQGRVWSGNRALALGLVDKLGGIDDAIVSAARMAEVSAYRLKEYPGKQNLFEKYFGSPQQSAQEAVLKEELGEEGFKTYQSIKKIRRFIGSAQARLPFEFAIK